MQNNVIDQEKLFEICNYKIKGYLKPVLILLGESEHATNAFMRRLVERLQKEEETVVTYFAEENQETACSETLMEQLICNIEEMCEVTKHFREAEEEGMKEPIIPSPVDAYRKKYLEYRNAYNDSKRNYIFSLLSLRNAEGYIFIEVPETMIFREYVGEIVKMFSHIPETKIKLILSYTGKIETEKSEEYLEDFPHIEIERIPAEGDNPTETDPICDREKKELTIELVKQAYDTRSEVLVGEIKEIIFREGEDFVVTWLQTMTPELTIKEENALHWLIKKLAAHEKTLELSAQMKTELLKRYETETGDGRTTKEVLLIN